MLKSSDEVIIIGCAHAPFELVLFGMMNTTKWANHPGSMHTRLCSHLIRKLPYTVRMQSAGPDAGHTHTNRLADEQSPYLLQHKHNPVDWYPWGAEAIDKAKKEDKIIFLSVGYATCHWCHVMERESFEDQETADLLNKNFVSVKVDREERPDVDRVYMAYVQAISGRGGWPMSVWLTPDLEPIYGGTYYPLKDMVQAGQVVMPSFKLVIRRLANMWESNREDLKAKGTSILSQLQQAMSSIEGKGEGDTPEQLEADVAEHGLTLCAEQLSKRFDARLGGFGVAPKFPRPSEINALMCAHVWHQVKGEEEEADRTLDMATFSLQKMAAGGMYDHVGGGFHRYSVDENWHVPHFEKMLYDNPQLVSTYLAATQLTGDRSYTRVVRGVLDYLRRDMTSPQGGLYSAEDADSFNPEVGHKTEGYFYVWTKKEVEEVLGPQRAALFCRAYNLKEGGNCTLSSMSDPHDEFTGKNVPILLKTLSQTAQAVGMSDAALEHELATARKLLHEVRARRPRPALDDKVVCAWNGLGLSAFSLAARVLTTDEPAAQPSFPVDGVPPDTYLQCAVRVAKFMKQELWDEANATLRRSYCKSASDVKGFADDYAYSIAGLLDLYQAGGGLQWLAWAEQLQQRQHQLFWDAGGGGGYFSTTTTDPTIKIRIKDSYDGAEPTASSIAASNLFRLAGFFPSATISQGSEPGAEQLSYLQAAQQTLAAFQAPLFETPLAVPQMCCAAFQQLQTPLRQVILACSPKQPDGLAAPQAQALLRAIHGPFAPDKVVILVDLSDAEQVDFWQRHNPEAVAMAQAHFKAAPGAAPTVFVCQNFTCQTPTTDPEKVVQLLGRSRAAPSTPQVMTNLPGLSK